MAGLDFLRIARSIAARAWEVNSLKGGRDIVAVNPLGQKTIRADVELEGIVASELRKAKVPCVLVTEEAGFIGISKKPKWKFVLDPLDGSENYKRGVPLYCLGLCYAPIHGRIPDIRESYIIELNGGDEFYAKRGNGVFRNGRRVRPSKVSDMKKAIISLDFNREWVGNKISPAAKLALFNSADMRRFGPDLLDMCYTTFGGVDGFVDGRGSLSAIHASGVALLNEDCVVTDEHGKRIDIALDVEARTGVVAAGTRKLHSQLLAALRK